jgi:hypothetical protein
MVNKRLIPDSTFFSFFLHNTNEPDFLERIINNFYVEIPPKIHKEIKNCKHSCNIEKFEKKLHIFDDKLANFSELLKPLFSKEEIEKGEHDVVVVGFFCYNMKLDFIMVIDDMGARKFVKRNFPYLEIYMKWTSNFLRDCFKVYKIFNKEEVLYLLNRMGNSTFRIDNNSLEKIIQEIKNE